MNRAAQDRAPGERKARGAFFTPPELAAFIAGWAIRSPDDRVYEPSCGEAAFLIAAAKRLRNLGAPRCVPRRLFGIDIHEESVEAATQALADESAEPQLTCGDFFRVDPPEERFEAVIGNPPYVRYQSFAGEARLCALQAALRQGVRLSGLASSWAAFTVHAASFLKPEGRLGLVLPAELLSVNYASQIRRFLMRRFGSVRLILFEDLVFPGVLEEVVLLLAEGSGGTDRFEVFQAKKMADLAGVTAGNWAEYSPREHEKWTTALLPFDTLTLFRKLTGGGGFEVLLDWGETYLGAVTGNNEYFSLSKERARALKLRRDELLRIVPPGSRHLDGLEFSAADWRNLSPDGPSSYLFAPRGRPPAAARRYIEEGERSGVHLAYKCRVRTPWWRVPLVARPDFVFTYMNHEQPRLIRNGARAHILNSVYGVRLHGARRKLGQDLLHVAWLNSVTLLGAEIAGRSYGGGILKHEPREADLLPVPSLEALSEAAPELRMLRERISADISRRRFKLAVRLVDQVLLRDVLGVRANDLERLARAKDLMFQRRMARARAQNGAH
jgi:hypothetical protein